MKMIFDENNSLGKSEWKRERLCACVWVYGCVDAWVRGCVGAWVRVCTELREPDRVRMRVSHQRDQKREIDRHSQTSVRTSPFRFQHFKQKKTKPSSSRCSRARRCETKTKKASQSFFLFLSERPQKLRIENWRGTISCFVFFIFFFFVGWLWKSLEPSATNQLCCDRTEEKSNCHSCF